MTYTLEQYPVTDATRFRTICDVYPDGEPSVDFTYDPKRQWRTIDNVIAVWFMSTDGEIAVMERRDYDRYLGFWLIRASGIVCPHSFDDVDTAVVAARMLL